MQYSRTGRPYNCDVEMEELVSGSIRSLEFVGHTIRYDAIAEFNVDSKAESGQLNLAHVTMQNKKV